MPSSNLERNPGSRVFSALSSNASLLNTGGDFPGNHVAQIPNAQGVLHTTPLSGLCWACLCLLLMDVGPWHLSKVFCPSSLVGSTVATVTWEALRYMESTLGDKKGVVFSGVLQVILTCSQRPLLLLKEWSCPRGPACHLCCHKGPPT